METLRECATDEKIVWSSISGVTTVCVLKVCPMASSSICESLQNVCTNLSVNACRGTECTSLRKRIIKSFSPGVSPDIWFCGKDASFFLKLDWLRIASEGEPMSIGECGEYGDGIIEVCSRVGLLVGFARKSFESSLSGASAG